MTRSRDPRNVDTRARLDRRLQFVTLASAFIAIGLPIVLAQQQIAVRVRAGYRQSADGFVEPAPPDFDSSARDIENQLRKDKLIRLVASDKEAQVLVLVISRSSHSQATGGTMTLPMGNNTMTVPLSAKWNELHVVLRVGEHTSEYASTCNSWGDCAKKVATPIRAWIGANAEALAK